MGLLDLHSILRDLHLAEKGIAQRRLYAANQPIITEGMRERRLYLIEHGCVRVTGRVELEDHRHIQPGLCDLGVGDVFGELSLFDGGPRSASVVAVHDSELIEYDAEALATHFDQHPEQGYIVLKELFSVLTSRLRQADRRLESLFAWGLKVHGIDKHL
jgi:CRP-like cAMP-binding protein